MRFSGGDELDPSASLSRNLTSLLPGTGLPFVRAAGAEQSNAGGCRRTARNPGVDGTRRANGCVRQQGAAELLTLECLVDGQAADASHRNTRAAGQPLGQRRRQVVQRHAARRKRAVGRHLAGSDFKRDAAAADAPLHVLAGLAGQVVVQRRDAAGKRVPVVVRPEGLQTERRGHFAPAISRRRALSARFMAGARGGGSINNSAKRF